MSGIGVLATKEDWKRIAEALTLPVIYKQIKNQNLHLILWHEDITSVNLILAANIKIQEYTISLQNRVLITEMVVSSVIQKL